MSEAENTFQRLHSVDVSRYVQKKGNVPYISWSNAWALVKEIYADATYQVYENPDGWMYWTDGNTAWVKVGVTINGQEIIERYPVMDYRMNSIALAKITSRHASDAIQRAITKCLARHGLAISLYDGEELPQPKAPESQQHAKKTDKPEKPEELAFCTECGCEITDVHRGKTTWTRDQIVEQAFKKFNRPVCYDCAVKLKTGND